jgi:GntR family transcriptional regulator, galactonate operon transcriptional repressor
VRKASTPGKPIDAATKRRARKADSVLHVLGQRIASGDFGPGDALPTELELGKRFGVSRASLREGLKALGNKGMVESRTRRGTTVLPRSSWDLLDPDVLHWLAGAPLDPEFMIALLEVRAIVEPAAARLAAQRATPAQLQEIERAYRGMAASLPHDVETCNRHDVELHERIIAASGNVLLGRLVAAFRTVLLSAFRISASKREGYENSLAEHLAVVTAIKRRAPAEAERAMRLLLSGTARDLAPALAPHVEPKRRRARQTAEKHPG